VLQETVCNGAQFVVYERHQRPQSLDVTRRHLTSSSVTGSDGTASTLPSRTWPEDSLPSLASQRKGTVKRYFRARHFFGEPIRPGVSATGSKEKSCRTDASPAFRLPL
jgi:hypothetical protein